MTTEEGDGGDPAAPCTEEDAGGTRLAGGQGRAQVTPFESRVSWGALGRPVQAAAERAHLEFGGNTVLKMKGLSVKAEARETSKCRGRFSPCCFVTSLTEDVRSPGQTATFTLLSLSPFPMVVS